MALISKKCTSSGVQKWGTNAEEEGTHMSQIAQGRLKPGRPLTPASAFLSNGLQSTQKSDEMDPIFEKRDKDDCFHHPDQWKIGYVNSPTNYKLAAQGIDLFEPSVSSAHRVASAGGRFSIFLWRPFFISLRLFYFLATLLSLDLNCFLTH